MIDKVTLRVPFDAPYAAKFGDLYKAIRNDPKGPFHQGQHYIATADLRDYGHPVVLHTHCLRDERGNHKLELIDTGAMSYSGMRHEINRIFATSTATLGVMRLDLAADVLGLSVSWFEQHVRARFKRWTADLGKFDEEVQFARMGRTGIETFYLGKRPNLFRIYNKIEELRNQYAQLKRRAKRDSGDAAQIEPFETIFGYPEKGFVLTRVERQISGSRMPGPLATFQNLRGAAQFNPFENLVFVEVGRSEPNPEDYDLPTYCTGMFIRQLIETQGIHRTRQFLNQHSKRNANRILQRHSDFLPPGAGEFNSQILLERYQESVSEQLAA